MNRLILAAFSALTVLCAPAAAQSNSLGGGSSNGIRASYSFSELAALLQANNMTSQTVTTPNGPILLVTAPAGGKFLVNVTGCQDEQQKLGCQKFELAIPFPDVMPSYDQLNGFHIQQSRVSWGMKVPQGSLLGSKIYTPGGTTDLNVLFLLQGFFLDAETFAKQFVQSGGSLVNMESDDFPELEAVAVRMAEEGDSPFSSYFQSGITIDTQSNFLNEDLVDGTDAFGR